MEKITFFESNKISSPNPLTLVCTTTPDKKTNIAPISWWTKLSFDPEMVGFAMAKTSYSGEMVRESKKVVLAMPTEEMAQAAFECGTASGRETDKVDTFGIELVEIPGNSIKIPLHSCMAIECSLSQVVEVGDHYLYVCRVDNILGDLGKKALFAWDEDKVSLRTAK
ncbi:MAG: flavin reductase family protein [Planctomycetaceae bacterium]|nr:flavin reductase family protein [Planctomycetaceae bacterium]